MAITPSEIRNAAFSPAENEAGYDPIEVDEFLDRISAEVDRLMKRVVELKTRCTQADGRIQSLVTEMNGLRQQLAAQEKSKVDGQLSETQLSEVFVVAKQTADKMITDAEGKAAGIIAEAEGKASDTIRQALVDKQKEIEEINRLQQSRARFLSDYQGLLRSYLEESATRLPISSSNMGVIEEATDEGESDQGISATATA